VFQCSLFRYKFAESGDEKTNTKTQKNNKIFKNLSRLKGGEFIYEENSKYSSYSNNAA